MLPTLPRLRFVVLGFALTGLSCAGAPSLAVFSGACDQEYERCSKRCEEIQDGRDCDFDCNYQARACAARQGEGQIGINLSGRIGDHEAKLIDLFGPRVQSSAGVTVELKGEITRVEGARAFAPGASMKMRFELPPDVRQAELFLRHGPAGKGTGCFLTLTLGEKTLLGRYAPPKREKGKGLRREAFMIMEHLRDTPKGEPTIVELFLFNNNAAGSTEAYVLSGVELIYRAIQK